YETEEDTLFASAGIGGIRAEYLLRKGIDFPFASSSHWFPDPDIAQTWLGSSNALDWYKGFNEESELSLDAQAEQGRAVYFGQCVLINKMLHAVRWNEGGLGDSGIDKKWRFYEAKKYTAGVKYKGPVSAQCSYASENGKFSEFWNFNTKSEKYSFLARWNFADSYIGAKTAIIKNHIPAGYNVHDDFDPYSINYYYGNTGRYESWKEYWLLGNFKGRNYNLKLAAKFFPDEKIKEAVITAEKSISLFSFKFSPLYFSDGVKNYLCSSFSAGVKKGALSVEAGAGMSPEDFSFTDESDRREDFLYNQNGWDKGYELLKEQEKIWLRAVLSF
ncbi:hypothetical protein KJ633_06980, partial [bacterium]|nr:hypothetical protein [bacterium]